MVHERQELRVHLAHLRPVGAMLIRDVQIIALISPRFVEDLLELGLEVDVGAQIGVDAARAGRRRIAVSVDDEKRRRNRATTPTRTPSPAATAASAIDELVAIETDVVVG